MSSSLLDDLLREALPAEGSNRRYEYIGPELRDHPAGRAIQKLAPAEQIPLALEAARRFALLVQRGLPTQHDSNLYRALPFIASQVMRRRLPYREEDLLHLAESFAILSTRFEIMALPVVPFVKALADHAGTGGLSPALSAAVQGLPDALEGTWTAEQRRAVESLRQLLRRSGPGEPLFDLSGGDAWIAALREEMGALPPEDARKWSALLIHAAAASASKPAAKWLAGARDLLDRLSPEQASRLLALSLGRLGKPGTRVRTFGGIVVPGDPRVLDEALTDLLRGLVWCAGLVADPALATALGAAAGACFRKVPNHGPLNAKIGNACVDTLSRLGTPGAVAQLSRLRTRVQHPSSRRQIEAALGRAAKRLGLTAAELEEMSVPTLDLEEVGLRRETLGDVTAELRVTGTASTELAWITPGGKLQKSVPKALKDSHPSEVRSLTAAAKEIQTVLAGQRDRIERLYLHPRQWDLATWRERYLDHPLVGTLARRLLWRFDEAGGSRTGFWRGGQIVDAEGRPLAGLGETARVALWHPLDSGAAEVQAWRRALEAWEAVQPFKQAHREVYVLTDAERRTGTYSNRFAAHILKQHQLAALCRQRGWACALQGDFDSDGTPTLSLPEHRMQVELWVQPVEGGGLSPMGISLYVSTDQVRFCDPTGAPRPLEQIPPLLFSELMRDVDLFVGVCSVGNDPAWVDQGEHPGNQYWQSYSFGDLGESARTRRELLERLVPRLKIAARCSLAERYLVVRGDLRTYKIHLGSGNILMEPNDQYLCIVRDASKTVGGAHPVLPFEGDGTLTLILSKAFLLADDRKIKDPEITRQIRG